MNHSLSPTDRRLWGRDGFDRIVKVEDGLRRHDTVTKFAVEGFRLAPPA